MTLLINNPSMRIYNILWHITQHSFSRGLSSSQMKRKLCKHFSKMSLFTAQYFKFNFCAPIFQFPLEQQIGGAFCRRPLSKTSAENFRQCSPTLDSTYHLQTHFHRLEKWSNQRKLARSRIWEDEKVQSVRKGVDGHGLERKRSRNEMDHWWHTSLSARPHNHYTNTQSPHKQTQTQRNKDKHGHINIIASKVFSDQRRLLGQTSPPTTNNRKQYLPFLSHICWENVCLFVYLFVYMFLYISLFVYLFICVFVYFD